MSWLVVDDEPSIGWALGRLAKQMGHEAVAVASVEEALAVDDPGRIALIVLDVRLPGEDGLSAFPKLRQRYGDVPVIVVTAYGDLSTAVDAVHSGAFEYLIKPFDLPAIERVLARALQQTRAVQPVAPPPKDSALLGQSHAMQTVFKQIALAADSETPVHIRGETGTGKELVAAAIHRFSRRGSGPFVTVHVAGLSESLIESELFGHVRGAFTGAGESHGGLLEQADGGTLFLDEVAEIPLALQTKLLRALETREFYPVGGGQSRRVDFRLISATHRDLRQGVADGSFRADLYYRLDGFRFELPPLRERGDDLFTIAEHYARRLAAIQDLPDPVLSEPLRQVLRQRRWPGNVRELKHAIEHAVIVSRGGVLLPEHLPAEAGDSSHGDVAANIQTLLRDWTGHACQAAPASAGALYQQLLDLVEPPVFDETLKACDGQLTAAAERLGIHRMTLRKRLARRAGDDEPRP